MDPTYNNIYMSYFIDHGKIVISWLVQKRLFNLNKKEINKLKAIKKVLMFCTVTKKKYY